MSDDSLLDAEIIRAAYAEKVKEAFKMFAENISVGQSEASCRERFVRSLELMRRARDVALEASSGTAAPDAAVDKPLPAADDPGAGLSEADRQMIEHALSGTTGQKPLIPTTPVNPRYR